MNASIRPFEHPMRASAVLRAGARGVVVVAGLVVGAGPVALVACDGASSRNSVSTGEPASSGAGADAGAGAARGADATPPVAPFRMGANAIEGRSADGTYIVRWEPALGHIPDAEPFEIRFAVRRADGAPIAPDARFVVDAEMPQHGHGMNLIAGTQRVAAPRAADAPAKDASGEEALVLANNILLHMPGRWVLALDIGEGGILERTQWFIDVE